MSEAHLVSQSDPSVRGSTLSEQAYRKLRELIAWGEMEPETRLVERDLAEQLRISRTPVREALRRLESEGLAVRLGASLLVAPFELETAVETLMTRELLEPFAAMASAPNLGAPQVARLRSIASEMKALLDRDIPDPRYGAELNMELHALLNSRCPYSRIIETIQVARDSHSALRLYSSYTHADLVRVHGEHLQIIEAAAELAAGEEGRSITPDQLGEALPGSLPKLIETHMKEAREALLRNISRPATTNIAGAGEEDPG